MTLAIVALVCLAGTVLGNGGGYERGGVEQTGGITGFEPKETQKVRILDEQLTVVLRREAAQVDIRYILKNTSNGKANVRFGFPVEEVPGRNLYEMRNEANSKKQERPALEYCRDYRVQIDGKIVPSKLELEPASSGTSDPRFKGIKGWLVSKIALGPGEENTMSIGFLADYPYSDVFVSDDGQVSAKEFKYRLSTGACWEGAIERGRISIRAEGIDPEEVRITKPVNRFHKTEGRWEWTFEDLEPSLADDIVVEAMPEVNSFGRHENDDFENGNYVEYSERGGKWFVSHSNYSVVASSTLPPQDGKTYEVNHVKKYSDTPWSEGAPGNGVGEWLALKPEVAKPLHALWVLPGYVESPDLFKANARPKKIEVMLNGEQRFEAPLEDSSDWQRIPVVGYDKPVKDILLTFEEVYPGSRFEDLCVSGVRLETRLNKKPSIRPAR